jgi:hypothetical protein
MSYFYSLLDHCLCLELLNRLILGEVNTRSAKWWGGGGGGGGVYNNLAIYYDIKF